MRPKTARPRSNAFTHYVPDIVITDWAMPIFDGLELAQMIRQPAPRPIPTCRSSC
jgi:YesN/AraC family two-component response regulator